MTMVAVVVHDDHAEILTDSSAYSPTGSALAACSKVTALPHIDAAVAVQGESAFGDVARLTVWRATSRADRVIGLDALVDALPDTLAGLWRNHAPTDRTPAETTVYLAGYSAREGQFAAWAFTSGEVTGEPFAAVRLDAPHVIPCPWSLAPDPGQLARFRAWDRAEAAQDGREPMPEEHAQQWASRPAMTAPRDVAEWRDLALLVRRERSLSLFGKVIVAGELYLTRLSRGEVTTRRIHTFDDTGEEFDAMVRGTLHPRSQVLPCVCGSGLRFIDCHLGSELDNPCPCGSGRDTFRRCCAAA